jgi:hypothetical protein
LIVQFPLLTVVASGPEVLVPALVSLPVVAHWVLPWVEVQVPADSEGTGKVLQLWVEPFLVLKVAEVWMVLVHRLPSVGSCQLVLPMGVSR